MKSILIFIPFIVLFWACSEDNIDLASPQVLSGTEWRSSDVGVAGTPVYLKFLFSSESQVEFWSKQLNENDYSLIFNGTYSIVENEIEINFSNEIIYGNIEGESLIFHDYDVWQSIGPDTLLDRMACNDNIIYAITNTDGVYMSSNGGSEWNSIYFGPNSGMEHGVDIEFKDGNVFAGSNRGGIYFSTNDGLDWNKVSDTPSDEIEIIGNTVISVRDNYSIQISSDNGNNWEIVNSNMSNEYFWALTSYGDKLYAGNNDGKIYMSDDYGKTLTSIASFNVGIMSLVVDGNNIIAGTQGKGLAISSNNGLNWRILSDVSGLYVNAVAKNGDLIVAHGDKTVFSIDNGNNWKTIGVEAAMNDLHVTENNIYVVRYYGIKRLPTSLLYLPNSSFTLYD